VIGRWHASCSSVARSNWSCTNAFDRAIRFLISIVVLAGAQQALAQQILQSDRYVLTVEGYANVTTSIADGLSVSSVATGMMCVRTWDCVRSDSSN
jgi:hypothetical protein